MRRLLLTALLPLSLLAVTLPEKALYLEGSSDKGIILAHGKGMHPDFKVVGPLRQALNEDLDFHTLSLQMPTNHEDYAGYEAEQPLVDAMIDRAIVYLKERGVKTVYLMGHSLGAGMTSSYLVSHPDASIAGYIAVGCRGNKSRVISCNDNMPKIKVRVLDVWGRANGEDEGFAATRATLVGAEYTQYGIDGANHVLDGAEGFFVDEVETWLEGQDTEGSN
jgi:pimeloyl-ACP methyl ester carboxylesterase